MSIGALGVYVCLFLALYFEVFLLISFFEKRPLPKTALKPKRYPSISVVVPSFNEEKTLGATIESLLALEYPKDKLEVYVVDDGSTDRTRSIAEWYVAKYPQVKYFHKKNEGKYTALNLGITHSKAELIGCLDADSFATPDALIEVVKQFEEHEDAVAVMPAMKVHAPRTMFERMQAVEYTFGVFYKKMFDNLGALNVLPGPFSFYKRSVFDTIGLFKHAHNTEDMEIVFRMHSHKLKILNAHNAVVYTTVPKTLGLLLKQRTRWSQGFLQNSRDYAYMYFNPKYGHFGMLVLPFGLIAFLSAMYTTVYMLYTTFAAGIRQVLDMWATQLPIQFQLGLEAPHFEWFYLNTSMLNFTIFAVLGGTVIAILLGNRIAQSKLGVLSFLSYFALFGFVAPMWLAKAVWGVARSRPASWR